jgi:hypothetical protein
MATSFAIELSIQGQWWEAAKDSRESLDPKEKGGSD